MSEPSKVHIFISKGRFQSMEQLRKFVDETYTEDGDTEPSPFNNEVRISSFSPDHLQAIHKPQAVPVRELLATAPHADQFLTKVTAEKVANVAICVYAPNVVRSPSSASIEYLGAFDYTE